MTAIRGRLEDYRLLTGQGRFASDWNFPDQAHAAFLRSDRAHADIVAIDTKAALALPGVLAVFTSADVKAAGFGPIPAMSPGPGRDGQEMKKAFKTILAEDRVRFVGECVACVVAVSPTVAQDATELITIDYAELPVVTIAADALLPGAPQLHAIAPDNLVLDYAIGDEIKTQAAFSAAARVVKLTVDNTRVVCNPMEPRSCTATYDSTKDLHTLYCCSQGVRNQRGQLALITGIPDEKLEVVAADVGGGFGVRSSVYPEYCAVLLAAKTLGRPVKWTSTRSELFLADDQARDTMVAGEVALDASARILAMRFSFLSNLGAYVSLSGAFVPTKSTLMCIAGEYDVPVLYARVKLALTNTSPTAAYRGAGRPITSHILERLIDQVACETGIDPVELRRRNLVKRDMFPYTAANGTVYDCGDFEGVLEKALEMADWIGFAERRNDSARRGKLRGRGIATFIEGTGAGFAPTDEVQLQFDADGNIAVYAAAQSQGQGHETSFAQVIAAALGVPLESIRVRSGEPGIRLTGNGAGGSRTMLAVGSVCHIASRIVIEKGKALAGEALEAAPADIEFLDGEYRIAGTNRTISMSRLIRQSANVSPHPLDTTGAGKFGSTFPNSCHIAEVEIDPETGAATIASYVGVDDAGNIINHQLVEGQMHGGIAQGAGHVFGEQSIYHQGTGQLLTGSFLDYAMPRADDFVEPRLVDLPVPTNANPLGAKGVGEAGMTGAVPTLMNAVVDALRQVGVTHFDMPASPQRLWRAIRAAKHGDTRAMAIRPEGLFNWT